MQSIRSQTNQRTVAPSTVALLESHDQARVLIATTFPPYFRSYSSIARIAVSIGFLPARSGVHCSEGREFRQRPLQSVVNITFPWLLLEILAAAAIATAPAQPTGPLVA